ncbi:MAG: prepilin-type N-terminal cleavage/methylation domain-containing protein [Candidatus Brocadiaceae bacterium]|nr:prepilin-type N-terminal cleavage/methylation domain-containing protein [Candidatus Brocadiaceae bacterium]
MTSAWGKNEDAFTLVELVIGFAITLILLGVAVQVFLTQRKSVTTQEQVSEMQQYLRSSMDMIVRDARMAGYDPVGIGFDGISVAETGTMTVNSDYNGNGTISGTESVTYAFDEINYQIDREAGAGAQPFAENIESLTFSYLDSSGVATTTVSGIRQIEISITGRTARVDPNYGFQYRYGTLTSTVTPKNLSF